MACQARTAAYWGAYDQTQLEAREQEAARAAAGPTLMKLDAPVGDTQQSDGGWSLYELLVVVSECTDCRLKCICNRLSVSRGFWACGGARCGVVIVV